MPRLPVIRTLTRPPGAALRAMFLAISRVEAVRSGGWDRHRHAEHEAIIVERGIYHATLNSASLQLSAGGVLVVKPGDWHEDLLRPGCIYHALWFRMPGGLFRPEVTCAQQQVSNGGLSAAVGRLERLAGTGATPAHLDAALGELLTRLVEALPAAGLSASFTAGDDFATRLQSACARLPAGVIRTAALARAMALSCRTLERRCRDELGCGPAEACSRWRMQRAGEMLRSTDWPVRVVSETLGFANPFHFSRVFTRVHGHPPAAWRYGGNG